MQPSVPSSISFLSASPTLRILSSRSSIEQQQQQRQQQQRSAGSPLKSDGQPRVVGFLPRITTKNARSLGAATASSVDETKLRLKKVGEM